MSAAKLNEGRVSGLAKVLKDKGLGAYFCTSGVTMGYLAGLREEGGERLLVMAVGANGQTRLVCPALTETQGRKTGITDIRSWRDGQDPLALMAELARDWNLAGATIAVDDVMRASLLLSLQSTLSGAKFVAGQPVVSELMRIKGADEIKSLKRAGEIADLALDPTLAQLKAGMTEWQVHETLTREMQVQGCVPNFCIVASGPHGAEPHHMTGQTPLQRGDVLVLDYGCIVDGYMSDITRTVALGEATDEQREVYRIVYKAHMAGRRAIKPGVPAEEIDRATRKVIVDAGYGEYFVHRTGHGLGMNIHEEPYICEGNGHRLEVGNVFSIEPGIYLPGRFGVRIENIVAVTEDGHESMNAEPSPELRVVPF